MGLDVAVPKPYPEEFRQDVVRVARNRGPGVTVEQVATDFGVHPMTRGVVVTESGRHRSAFRQVNPHPYAIFQTRTCSSGALPREASSSAQSRVQVAIQCRARLQEELSNAVI